VTKVNLTELLKKHLIEKVDPDENLSKELLTNAERDLKAAEDNLNMKHTDWALAIAYNAMLSAGRALMAKKGYRAVAESHHIAVVQFCAAVLPTDSTALVAAFNRYRVRRHDVIYGEAESVGFDEARKAIDNAKKFVQKIKEIIENK
jgi:uncharacterized protein (UPF0332 family)